MLDNIRFHKLTEQEKRILVEPNNRSILDTFFTHCFIYDESTSFTDEDINREYRPIILLRSDNKIGNVPLKISMLNNQRLNIKPLDIYEHYNNYSVFNFCPDYCDTILYNPQLNNIDFKKSLYLKNPHIHQLIFNIRQATQNLIADIVKHIISFI